MPVERAYPTAELLSAMREYHEATGRRMVLAWTMIAGVNTRPADAEMLAELIARAADQARSDRGERSDRPVQAAVAGRAAGVSRALTAKLGVPVGRRYSGGADIAAACGMLAGAGSREFAAIGGFERWHEHSIVSPVQGMS